MLRLSVIIDKMMEDFLINDFVGSTLSNNYKILKINNEYSINEKH